MSNVIIDLFNASGMSVAEFARRADLKYSTAHDIVSGKSEIGNIGVGAFIRIARVFNTTADALAEDIETQPKQRETVDELVRIFESITPEGQLQLLIYARGVAVTYSKNNQAKAV